MTYITAEARQEMLDDIAHAIDAMAQALAALGGAYELLDDATADTLEEQLFRPVQLAYGRAKRTHTEFARRYDFPERAFAPAVPGAPSHGVKGFVDTAVDAVDEADRTLTEIQDSMMPVEVGDPELRAGLAETRARLGSVRGAARDFVRILGR